jgi:hypothetical protein
MHRYFASLRMTSYETGRTCVQRLSSGICQKPKGYDFVVPTLAHRTRKGWGTPDSSTVNKQEVLRFAQDDNLRSG